MGYKVYIRNISKIESKQRIRQAISNFGDTYKIDIVDGPSKTWYATVQYKKQQSKIGILKAGRELLKGSQVFGEAICFKCFDDHGLQHKYGQQCIKPLNQQLKSKISATSTLASNSSQASKNQKKQIIQQNHRNKDWIILTLIDGTQKAISLDQLGITSMQIKQIKIQSRNLKQPIQPAQKLKIKPNKISEHELKKTEQLQNYAKERRKKNSKTTLSKQKVINEKVNQKILQQQIESKFEGLKINESSIEIYSQFVNNIEISNQNKKKTSKHQIPKISIS